MAPLHPAEAGLEIAGPPRPVMTRVRDRAAQYRNSAARQAPASASPPHRPRLADSRWRGSATSHIARRQAHRRQRADSSNRLGHAGLAALAIDQELGGIELREPVARLGGDLHEGVGLRVLFHETPRREASSARTGTASRHALLGGELIPLRRLGLVASATPSPRDRIRRRASARRVAVFGARQGEIVEPSYRARAGMRRKRHRPAALRSGPWPATSRTQRRQASHRRPHSRNLPRSISNARANRQARHPSGHRQISETARFRRGWRWARHGGFQVNAISEDGGRQCSKIGAGPRTPSRRKRYRNQP